MRPMKIIELTSRNSNAAKPDRNAVYAFEGKIWKWQPVGCVCCLQEDEDDFRYQTIVDEEGNAYCMEHGNLQKVVYQVVRNYKIRIGEKVREGKLVKNDHLLIPANFSEEDKGALLDEALDETVQLEEEEFEGVDINA